MFVWNRCCSIRPHSILSNKNIAGHVDFSSDLKTFESLNRKSVSFPYCIPWWQSNPHHHKNHKLYHYDRHKHRIKSRTFSRHEIMHFDTNIRLADKRILYCRRRRRHRRWRQRHRRLHPTTSEWCKCINTTANCARIISPVDARDETHTNNFHCFVCRRLGFDTSLCVHNYG